MPDQESVIVVGAGPVGLTAALALRTAGLPATIVEAEAESRTRPGSRAIYVHGTTLRTLERLRPGLGVRLAERGVVWPTRRTRWRDRDVFVRTYAKPAGAGLPHFASLPQTVVEELLLEACRETGVEIVWESKVTGVKTGANGVELELAAAEDAQREAKKKASKELREARHEKQKEEVDTKIAQLKAKLPGHKHAAGAHS